MRRMPEAAMSWLNFAMAAMCSGVGGALRGLAA